MAENNNDIYGSISISPEPPEPRPPKKKSASKQAPPPKPSRRTRPPERERDSRAARRPDPDRRPRRGGRKLAVWFTLLVLLFGLYSAAGYLLVPYLVQHKVPGFLAEKTGVSLSTGRISFNPYNFKLVARDVSAQTISEDKPDERFLTIDDLRINLDFLSLLRGELTCSEMIIERLKLHIVRRQDKSYNISYLLNNRRRDNHSEIIDFAELPFLFSFNNISISESRILIEDTISGREHVISNIELDLPVISNFPYQTDSYIHPRFSAVINGSPVTLTGEASIGGGGRQSQLSLDINDIDMPLYFDYLPLTLPIDITTGTANGVLHLTFSPQEKQGSRFKIGFNLETTNLGLASRDAAMSLTMPGAQLDGSLEPFTRVLSFKSILLREPVVVTDLAEDASIGATLASLAPLALRPPPEHKLHQVIPPIAIKLLIAEGGSFTIRDQRRKKDVQHWEAIQLSIKNFSNDRRLPSEEESLFRLSGEHQSTAAYFIWQGIFDAQNRPGGNLQLNGMPADLIAPFLGRKAADIGGTADLKGLFSLESPQQEGQAFGYSLKSSTLTIKELELKEQGKVWLKTPVMRCDPVSRFKGITDLGNVYLQNSVVNLERDKLPYLFLVFSARPTQHVLHGIDFSGSIVISGDGAKKPDFSLKEVVFQANKLEKQEPQKDNFVFSANLGTGSDIKAKGSFHIAPVQISSELSASKMSPAQLFSWFSDSPTLLDSQATISLTGTFLYPQQEFSGELAAENVRLGSGRNKSFSAETIHFNDFAWSRSRSNLSVKKLLVDQPAFTWHRLDTGASPVSASAAFLRTYLFPDADSGQSSSSQATGAFSINIDQVGISNGMITYEDERTKPTLELSLNGISGELQNQHYPPTKKKGAVSLNGSIERVPFKIEGEANLLARPPSAALEFTAASLPLSLFAPQVTGRIRDIDADNATVDVSYRLNQGGEKPGYTAQLRINNLVPVKSGTNLATAFALLAGSGSGGLTIELEGQQPSRAIIDGALDSFSRTMIKASINPLLLADHEFVDLADKDFVTFLPGTDQFTGETVERLNRFGELLSTYPLINLKITGLADPESDVDVLLEELKKAEQLRVDLENQKRKLEWQQKLELEKMRLQIWSEAAGTVNETDIPVIEDRFEPLTPQPVQVTSQALSDLALRRQQAVIDYLTGQLSVDPARLAQAAPENSGIVSGADSPRALISLTDGYDLSSTENRAENQVSPARP